MPRRVGGRRSLISYLGQVSQTRCLLRMAGRQSTLSTLYQAEG
jgi:hypothetical protein